MRSLNPLSISLRAAGFETIFSRNQCETKPLYRRPTANDSLRFDEVDREFHAPPRRPAGKSLAYLTPIKTSNVS